MTTRYLKFLLSVLGGVVGMAAVLLVFIVRPVISAKSVVGDIVGIDKGGFNAMQLRQWADRHRGSVVCDGQRCQGTVEESNDVLHFLHLAPSTRFSAVMTTVDDHLVQSAFYLSDVNYSPDAASGAATHVVLAYSSSEVTRVLGSPVSGAFVAQGPVGKLPGRLYVVTPESSKASISLAYKINVWCLARIGGCSGPQQAPDIWSLPETARETREKRE